MLSGNFCPHLSNLAFFEPLPFQVVLTFELREFPICHPRHRCGLRVVYRRQSAAPEPLGAFAPAADEPRAVVPRREHRDQVGSRCDV